MVYPEKIAKRLASVESRTDGIDRNAVGTEANFSCGCVVCFSLSIDFENSLITGASFSSNGCGFMVAAADILAEKVKHRRLLELHGLKPSELTALIITELSEIKRERRECVNACVSALKAAFADFRSRQIEEFRGEKALICTCFGVTEEVIETLIERASLTTVNEVTANCNAGAGCGSCRMLIQEMLDGRYGHI